MTVKLDEQAEIRAEFRQGVSMRELAIRYGRSRNTISRICNHSDYQPTPPIPKGRKGILKDEEMAFIDSCLEYNLNAPPKQKHTAKRIYDRLVEEMGYTHSISTVERYVRKHRKCSKKEAKGYMELTWQAGVAQADYGTYYATIAGTQEKLHALVLTFPYSNARFVYLTRAERQENVCHGLVTLFHKIGVIPHTLVLDNATELGRCIKKEVIESELFKQLKSYYSIKTVYCNPYSGNEKGNVENAVGFLRRNYLVPEPSFDSLDAVNEWLFEKTQKLLEQNHYKKKVPITELFAEDIAHSDIAPKVPFDPVRWEKRMATAVGTITVDEVSYLAGPTYHSQTLLIGLRNASIEIVTQEGKKIVEHERRYDKCSKTQQKTEQLIAPLICRPRAWESSELRNRVSSVLKEKLDGLGELERQEAIRCIYRVSKDVSIDAVLKAADTLYQKDRTLTEFELDTLSRRMESGEMWQEDAVNLAAYDELIGKGEAA